MQRFSELYPEVELRLLEGFANALMPLVPAEALVVIEDNDRPNRSSTRSPVAIGAIFAASRRTTPPSRAKILGTLRALERMAR